MIREQRGARVRKERLRVWELLEAPPSWRCRTLVREQNS